VIRLLDRADDLEAAVLLRERDQSRSHPSCGAGDGEVDHVGLFTG
jgi:hypothetical protein